MGGQPQIVTFTLDLLLERAEPVDQVVVVYMASNPRYRQAFQTVSGEFAGDRYGGQECRLRGLPVKIGDSAIAEAHSPAEVDAVWQTFNRLFADLKAQNQHLHLSMTGGRRILALLAFSVAMLHFTPTDRAWHLFTPPEVTEQARDGALMHAGPNSGLSLIEVPLVPWGAYFPGVRRLLGLSPQEARAAHLGWLDDTELANCRKVWDGLTQRQREVLRALAEGQKRNQVAGLLSIDITTVDSHKTEILRRCRKAWSTDERLDIIFLQKRFGPFLKRLDEV